MDASVRRRETAHAHRNAHPEKNALRTPGAERRGEQAPAQTRNRQAAALFKPLQADRSVWVRSWSGLNASTSFARASCPRRALEKQNVSSIALNRPWCRARRFAQGVARWHPDTRGGC